MGHFTVFFKIIIFITVSVICKNLLAESCLKSLTDYIQLKRNTQFVVNISFYRHGKNAKELYPSEPEKYQRVLEVADRHLEIVAGQWKRCSGKRDCFYYDEAGERLELDFSEPRRKNLKIVNNEKFRKIYVPENWSGIKNLEDEKVAESWLNKALIDHRWNPTFRSGNERKWRTSQKNALSLISFLRNKSQERKLLVSMPTGQGKTLVLAESIWGEVERIRQSIRHQSNGEKVAKGILFTADNNEAVEQFNREWSGKLNKIKDLSGVKVLRLPNDNIRTLAALNSYIEQSEDVVLVVGSMSSIRKKMGLEKQLTQPLLEEEKKANKRLAQNISFWAYDEARHVGAPLAQEVDRILVDQGRAFFLGVDATPMRSDLDLRGEYLDGRVFDAVSDHWTSYLQSLLKEKDELNTTGLRNILDQLELSINSGELNGNIRSLHLDTKIITQKADDFYVSKEGAHIDFVNPKYWPEVYGKRLRRHFEEHKKSTVVVASIEEAEKLSDFLRETYPKIEVQSIHTGNKNYPIKTGEKNKRIQSFKEAEHGIAVVVNVMNQSIDIPELSLMVDMTRNRSLVTIIQRLGRLMRPHIGKAEVEVISPLPITLDNLDERLMFYQFIKRHQVDRGEGPINVIDEAFSDTDDIIKRLIHFKRERVYGENKKAKEVARFLKEFVLSHNTNPNHFVSQEGLKGNTVLMRIRTLLKKQSNNEARSQRQLDEIIKYLNASLVDNKEALSKALKYLELKDGSIPFGSAAEFKKRMDVFEGYARSEGALRSYNSKGEVKGLIVDGSLKYIKISVKKGSVKAQEHLKRIEADIKERLKNKPKALKKALKYLKLKDDSVPFGSESEFKKRMDVFEGYSRSGESFRNYKYKGEVKVTTVEGSLKDIKAAAKKGNKKAQEHLKRIEAEIKERLKNEPIALKKALKYLTIKKESTPLVPEMKNKNQH